MKIITRNMVLQIVKEIKVWLDFVFSVILFSVIIATTLPPNPKNEKRVSRLSRPEHDIGLNANLINEEINMYCTYMFYKETHHIMTVKKLSKPNPD